MGLPSANCYIGKLQTYLFENMTSRLSVNEKRQTLKDLQTQDMLMCNMTQAGGLSWDKKNQICPKKG